jgi:soluble lytic murein transglycosylase
MGSLNKIRIFPYISTVLAVLLPFPLHADAPVTVTPQVTLREVIETGLLGIQKEPEAIHTQVRESARKYVSFRRGVLTQREVESWTQSCKSDLTKDDFCPLILGMEPNEPNPEDIEIREEVAEDKTSEDSLISEVPIAKASVKDTVQNFKEADFEALKRSTTSNIYRALRKFPDWSALTPVTDRVLRENSRENCVNPALATGLGQKAEMFFPDPLYRELAFKFYEKVIDCPTSEIATRARFRYSLHKIDGGDCKSVEPILDRIYKEGGGEYGPRTLYWKATCAKRSGNTLQYRVLSQRLLKEYPISYHSIVLNRADAAKLSRVMGVGEPTVLLRSHAKPKINSWIRAIEGLRAIGADDLARRVIYQILDPLLKTESSLRLYMGVLANQVGDPISQFRFLTSVFKDAPELISQNTLKLFYPLKNYPMIQKYSSQTDSLFIASLIRQESGFNPWAMSRVGARGLMQLMPATARRMEKVSKNQLLNPGINIRLGTRFISSLVNRYDRDAELALAAYNAGPGVVDQWKRRYTTQDRMLFLDLIPYKETRDYVALIARNYFWYNNLYGDQLGVPARSGGQMHTYARGIASGSGSQKLVFTLFQ